jgi:trans-aconitate 2-methyltransferase
MRQGDPWNPEQYNRFRTERTQPFHDLVAMISPQAAMSIADLGCGTGELTRQLHERFGARRTVGIDNSPNMLTKSAEHATAGLTFELGDLGSFARPNEFDLIFSNAAIQWAPDHPALLASLTRSLRADGQLAIQVPANDDHITHEAARIVARTSPFRESLSGWTRSPAVLSVERYAQLLYDLKYRAQSVRLIVYAHVLQDREAVVEWVKVTMLTDYQKRLPSELWVRFLDAFRSELFGAISDVKPFFYPFNRILFWARR